MYNLHLHISWSFDFKTLLIKKSIKKISLRSSYVRYIITEISTYNKHFVKFLFFLYR